MLKFFRKHNKKLLAIFMSLLMIVFVGGSALESLLTPATDRVVAESKFGEISFEDQRRATAMTQILERLGIPWMQPFAAANTEPLTTVDWILLTREAEAMGMDTSPLAAKAWAANLFGGELDEIARRQRIKKEHILRALAEYLAVRETGQAVVNATVPSVAEVRTVGSRMLDKVQVNAVVLPAKAFYDSEAEFSEEQIQEQWSKYRDNEPGPGLNFGYYVAPAVKVQFVKIDRDVLSEKVGIANLARKARQYYDQHQSEPVFTRPPEQASTIGADGELEGPPPPAQLGWEEAQEIAEQKVREEAAAEVAERLANWVIEQATVRWIDQVADASGYKPAPPEVAELDHYEELIKRLPPSLAYPEALSVRTTGFFSQDTATTVESIGTAAFRPPTGLSLPLRTLAFKTQGLVEKIPDDEAGSRSDYTAMYQTCQYPLTDFAGNYYVFRVVETRPGHPAESVDEVRDRVIADLRLLKGMEAAQARAEGLRACTPGETLQEAYESDEALVDTLESSDARGGGYYDAATVARTTLQQATRGSGADEVFVPGGIGSVPSDVVGQWFALEFADTNTGIWSLPDRAAVILIEWVQTLPGREDEYEENKTRLVSQMTQRRTQDALRDWLDPEQIRARNSFTLTQQ